MSNQFGTPPDKNQKNEFEDYIENLFDQGENYLQQKNFKSAVT